MDTVDMVGTVVMATITMAMEVQVDMEAMVMVSIRLMFHYFICMPFFVLLHHIRHLQSCMLAPFLLIL